MIRVLIISLPLSCFEMSTVMDEPRSRSSRQARGLKCVDNGSMYVVKRTVEIAMVMWSEWVSG